MLQEKGCIFLWPNSGHLSLQLSCRMAWVEKDLKDHLVSTPLPWAGLPVKCQCLNVVVRVESLRFRKARRITPFLSQRQCVSVYPLRDVAGTFYLLGNSHVTTPWTAIVTPVDSGDTMIQEMYHPPLCYAQIYCLVSRNIQ